MKKLFITFPLLFMSFGVYAAVPKTVEVICEYQSAINTFEMNVNTQRITYTLKHPNFEHPKVFKTDHMGKLKDGRNMTFHVQDGEYNYHFVVTHDKGKVFIYDQAIVKNDGFLIRASDDIPLCSVKQEM